VEYITASLMEGGEGNDLEGTSQSSSGMRALTGEAAQTALYVNLAAVYATQDEHVQVRRPFVVQLAAVLRETLEKP
jgi:hypothetical protein